MSILSDLGGGFVGKAVDIWSAREASKDERAFSERMSNTSYQRAVADMRAAGLNPMLAYQQGGASTPSTSPASTGEPLMSSVGSAVQQRRLRSEIALLQQQTNKTMHESDRARSESQLTEWINNVIRDHRKEFEKGVIAPYIMQDAGIASAKAEQKFWQDIGEGGKVMQFLAPFFNLLKPKSGGITINK